MQPICNHFCNHFQALTITAILVGAQSLDRIDVGGSGGGQQRGSRANRQKDDRCNSKRYWIGRRYAEQLRRQ
jgi:hypothetical protein